MELSFRRWKPGQLLAGWAAYWAGLIGVTLGPAIGASWRATKLPEGHGSIEAGFTNGTVHFNVIEDGVKTFAGTTSITTALLWLALPPLVLWVAWLILRERPDARPESLPAGGAEALPAGTGPAAEWRPRSDVRVGGDRGRVRTPNP